MIAYNIFILAKETFAAVGQTLKIRRKHDELDVMQSYIPIEKQDDTDPADQDSELKRALEASMKLAEEKMSKVIRQPGTPYQLWSLGIKFRDVFNINFILA